MRVKPISNVQLTKIRNPNKANGAIVRTSPFGFLSDFGLRVSGFEFVSAIVQLAEDRLSVIMNWMSKAPIWL